MLRKVIIRSLTVGAAVLGLAMVALFVAGLMAVQVPDFYSQVKAQDLTGHAEEWVDEQGDEFRQWVQSSIKTQRRSAESTNDTVDDYDPSLDTHSISVSELQLNGMLASGLTRTSDVKDPRVKLSEGYMQLGLQVVVNESPVVVSTSLKPFVGDDGGIHFEIQSGHVGNLRIPLQTLLSMLQDKITPLSSDLQLDLSGAVPVLIWKQKRDEKSPTIQSVVCSEGQLEITFQAPVFADKVGVAGGAIPSL